MPLVFSEACKFSVGLMLEEGLLPGSWVSKYLWSRCWAEQSSRRGRGWLAEGQDTGLSWGFRVVGLGSTGS